MIGILENRFKYLGWITTIVITFQLVSDITAAKLIDFFGYPVSITVLYFPITYVLSDILTEVYGYECARTVLWKSLFASIVAGAIYQIVAFWPPATIFNSNESYKDVFTIVPRVLFGGWIAVFVGEITNNFVMSKLKVYTKGKYLWIRLISSTAIGQILNTTAFYGIALSFILPPTVLFEAIIIGSTIKIAVEIVLLPFTYWICSVLKRNEGVDTFDIRANYNPFIIRNQI